MTQARVGTAVQAHTGRDGSVWFLEGDRMPEHSGRSVADFLSGPVLTRSSRVRVMGVPGNVRLILELVKRRSQVLTSVQVCSPLACESVSRRECPESLLLDLREWSAAPSCGGWHEFTNSDLPSYRLSECGGSSSPAVVRGLLEAHPAGYALTAMPDMDLAKCADLIGLVLDPRFFIDRHNPDRVSKLEAFLGIDPKVASSAGSSAPSVRRERYRLVLGCWRNRFAGPAGSAPDEFLWRVYKAAGGGWKGELRASQAFVNFLRHVWLDGLYQKPVWGERLFVPEYFFGNDLHALNWFKRLDRVKKC